MSASADSLTGVWHGIYSYPRDAASVSFVATLIETASAVTGTTHELGAAGAGRTLYATVVGSRNASAVSFIKTYDGDNPLYGTVAYEGRVSGDRTEIEGRWNIPGVWSGKFLMIRERGREVAVSRKAAVKA
jgi:hypothetical protein